MSGANGEEDAAIAFLEYSRDRDKFFRENEQFRDRSQYDGLTSEEAYIDGYNAGYSASEKEDKYAPMGGFEFGKNAWKQESKEPLTVGVDAPFEKFKGIKVDGKPVNSKYYRASAGSTIITLSILFLKTLAHGTHTLTVIFIDREIDIKFYIANPLEVLKTIADKIDDAPENVENVGKTDNIKKPANSLAPTVEERMLDKHLEGDEAIKFERYSRRRDEEIKSEGKIPEDTITIPYTADQLAEPESVKTKAEKAYDESAVGEDAVAFEQYSEERDKAIREGEAPEVEPDLSYNVPEEVETKTEYKRTRDDEEIEADAIEDDAIAFLKTSRERDARIAEEAKIPEAEIATTYTAEQITETKPETIKTKAEKAYDESVVGENAVAFAKESRTRDARIKAEGKIPEAEITTTYTTEQISETKPESVKTKAEKAYDESVVGENAVAFAKESRTRDARIKAEDKIPEAEITTTYTAEQISETKPETIKTNAEKAYDESVVGEDAVAFAKETRERDARIKAEGKIPEAEITTTYTTEQISETKPESVKTKAEKAYDESVVGEDAVSFEKYSTERERAIREGTVSEDKIDLLYKVPEEVEPERVPEFIDGEKELIEDIIEEDATRFTEYSRERDVALRKEANEPEPGIVLPYKLSEDGEEEPSVIATPTEKLTDRDAEEAALSFERYSRQRDRELSSLNKRPRDEIFSIRFPRRLSPSEFLSLLTVRKSSSRILSRRMPQDLPNTLAREM